MKEKVAGLFQQLLENFPKLNECKDDISEAFTLLTRCYHGNGKVLICGNGGSAADTEHIVGELMKSFLIKRPVHATYKERLAEIDPVSGNAIANGLEGALPALSLVSQTSLMSAFANDVAADMVFAQQVYGYGRNGDALIAISTSGNSSNVCKAAAVAKASGLFVIGLTGERECALDKFSDVTIHAPSKETFRIQEYHLPVYHTLCAMLEEEFYG